MRPGEPRHIERRAQEIDQMCLHRRNRVQSGRSVEDEEHRTQACVVAQQQKIPVNLSDGCIILHRLVKTVPRPGLLNLIDG